MDERLNDVVVESGNINLDLEDMATEANVKGMLGDVVESTLKRRRG